MAKKRNRTAKPKPPALVEKTVVMEPPDDVETTTVETGGPTRYVPFGKAPAKPAPPKVDVPADGTLIRKDGEPTVYVMKGGYKRPLRDANVFAACGFGWNDIVVLSPEEIDPIPTGDVVARQSDLQGKGA